MDTAVTEPCWNFKAKQLLTCIFISEVTRNAFRRKKKKDCNFPILLKTDYKFQTSSYLECYYEGYGHLQSQDHPAFLFTPASISPQQLQKGQQSIPVSAAVRRLQQRICYIS